MTADTSFQPVEQVVKLVYGHFYLCDVQLALLRAHYLFKQVQQYSYTNLLFLSYDEIRFLTLVYVLRSFNKQIYSFDAMVNLISHYNNGIGDAAEKISSATLRYIACTDQNKAKTLNDLFNADNLLSALFKGNFARCITLDVVDWWINYIRSNLGEVQANAERVKGNLKRVIEETSIVNNTSIDVVSLLLLFLDNVKYDIYPHQFYSNIVYLLIYDEINVSIDVKAERIKVNYAFSELKRMFSK